MPQGGLRSPETEAMQARGAELRKHTASSVFDSLPKRAMRGLMDLVVGDGTPDPSDAVSMMPAAGMVTGFLKRGVGALGKMVPDVAARELGTKRAMSALQGLLGTMEETGSTAKAGVMRIAERYPRVMAHLHDIGGLSDETLKQSGGRPLGGAYAPRMRGRGSLELADQGPRGNLVETFGHELGHAAQGIGLKRFDQPGISPGSSRLYNAAREQAGYRAMPQEVSARAMGRRKGFDANSAMIEAIGADPLPRSMRPAAAPNVTDTLRRMGIIP